jgi:hypothetical protein
MKDSIKSSISDPNKEAIFEQKMANNTKVKKEITSS